MVEISADKILEYKNVISSTWLLVTLSIDMIVSKGIEPAVGLLYSLVY